MRESIQNILREAGQMMLEAKNIENAVQEKEGPANFVTRYDVAVQQLLRQKLLALRPNAHFVGEEGDARDDVLHGEAFIVDPIDGTTNFIKHYDASAVSVALTRDGEVVMGATYNPYRDEFFYAEKGRGATCNGKVISVAESDLAQSLVCFGTSPYYPELIPRTFALAQALLTHALDLRRSGSAVIDICDVARGRIGLMFELKLSPWDYAAASLILTEAGGRISQLDGTPLVFHHPCSVLAATPRAYRDFFGRELNHI